MTSFTRKISPNKILVAAITIVFFMYGSTETFAACLIPGQTDSTLNPPVSYNQCTLLGGGGGYLICIDANSTIYSCCTDRYTDTCPPTPAATPIPTPAGTDSDPNRGGRGEPCNLNGTCDSSSYTCTQVPYSGKLCLVKNDSIAGGVPNTDDTIPAFRMCEQLSGDAFDKCAACVGDPDNPQNVWTALGCVPTSPQGFAEAILKLGIGLGGGIALLLMIFGAFQVAVSSGDPKTADAGKQTFTGAIIGLLFIIFSVVILRFIGFDILRLPGF